MVSCPLKDRHASTTAAERKAIREMIREIDQRDELIADLQRRIEELEEVRNSSPSVT
jgi:hypothetical protein